MNRQADDSRSNEAIHNFIQPATQNNNKQEIAEIIRPSSSCDTRERHDQGHVDIKHKNICPKSGYSSEEEKCINQQDKNQDDNNNQLNDKKCNNY